MILSSLLVPLVLQAAATQVARPTTEEARLTECLEYSRNDPPTALSLAGEWLAEASGAEKSYPQQCLGQTYVSLLRWGAAADAFKAARDLRLPDDHRTKARLAGMAGNAELAADRTEDALSSFDIALSDAEASGDEELAASIGLDRAEALVKLARPDDAAAALETARTQDPQSARAWLLSATLSRRMERLDDAAGQIETALSLAPEDPGVVLEAGVIAALGGEDDKARTLFQHILISMPDSDETVTAQFYLDQLDRNSG